MRGNFATRRALTVYHFCSYFDRNYLLRGLTLYRSLRATGSDFTLTVLALDDETHATLRQLALPNLHTVELAELEEWDPALAAAKGNRSTIEYYFTLSPILPLYVLTHQPEVELITYVDADLYFYRSPRAIFEEMGGRSILVIEHRYPPHLREKERFGRFNVQYETFRRDDHGIGCLERWRDQCLEWCYDRVEDERYADQKYLDEWPARYGEHLTILRNKGAGVAPWNWTRYPMTFGDGTLRVDETSIIFYHFHGLKIFRPWFISTGLADWGVMPRRLARWIYGGYVRELRATRDWLREQGCGDYPLKDRFIRGKGISVTSLGEIIRKAWSQAMLVF